jgi:hypothetical protein
VANELDESAAGSELRAAAMLREAGLVSFDAKTERALAAIAADMNLGRVDLIRMALSEWIEMRENARSSADTDTGLAPAEPEILNSREVARQ